MKPFDDMVDRTRENPMHIVLAEGEDPRVIEGAVKAAFEGVARVTLLGREDVILDQASNLGLDFKGLPVSVIDPATSDAQARYAQILYQLRKKKGLTREQAEEQVRSSLYFADLMVRSGDADGSVAGAQYTTAETVRAAIQVIGLRDGTNLVSSFFIMMLCEPFHDLKGALILSDCGLVVDPDENELAEIAIAASDSARSLLAMEPRAAMLSFSTKGSASHSAIDKVVLAAAKVRAMRPDLKIDGEMQLDAAIVPEVSQRKTPDSEVGGHANVLIFPDLQSGNIGYKLVERLGKAKAIGPILQGLNQPANDLSRGCNADDVFRVIVVTAAQAQQG